MFERDLILFPHDETGNKLWLFVNEGVALTQAETLEFSIIFPTKQQALSFGHILLEHNQKISFTAYQGSDDYPWEITAYPDMPLSHQNITGYQTLLEDNAAEFQGIFDGWYCPVVENA